MTENKLLGIAVIVFLFGISVRLFVIPGFHENTEIAVTPAAVESPFAGFFLPNAKSAYVYDAVTGEVLFSQNSKESLPLASLTKVMTVLVSGEVLAPSAPVLISKSSVSVRGGGQLKPGESWRFNDLAGITLVASLNDGAVALSENVGRILLGADASGAKEADYRKKFVDTMNQKAAALQLSSLRFSNESGLDESLSISGAYGTAEDVAKLFAYGAINHAELFDATHEESITARSLGNRVVSLSNTNTGLAALHGAMLSKTGTTPLAGGNLGVVFDVGINHPVVAVVLGDIEENRVEDMAELVRRTEQYFSTRRY